MKTINVKITLTLPVEVPDTTEYDDIMFFDIEENHCPGTGLVGIAFDRHLEKFKDTGMCWACALDGKNEII